MRKWVDVPDLKCPAIVIPHPLDENGDPRRCDGTLYVELGVFPESGNGYAVCECEFGHTLREMARDLGRDLDGVPVNV